MNNVTHSQASGYNHMAFPISSYTKSNYKPYRGRKPSYYSEIITQYPNRTSLYIAVDWRSLNFLRDMQYKGLFCDQPPEIYDLILCHTKDIYVFYNAGSKKSYAERLAHLARKNGAKNIYLFFIDDNFIANMEKSSAEIKADQAFFRWGACHA